MSALATAGQIYPHLEQGGFDGSRIFALSNINADGVGLCSMAINDKVDYTAMRILQSAGILSLFTGGLLTYNGWKELQLCRRLQDFWGEIKALGFMATGGLQFGGGLTTLGMLLAMGANWITTHPAAQVAANTLGNISGGFMGVAGFFGVALAFSDMAFTIKAKGDLATLDVNGLRQAVKDPQLGLLWKKVLREELIQELIGNGDVDENFLQKTHAHLNKKLAIQSTVAMLGVVGIVLGFLAFTSLPVAPWVFILVGLGIGLGTLLLDGMELQEELSGATLSTKEKVTLYGITFFGMGLAETAASFAKGVTFGLTTALFGVFLTLVQLFMIYTMQSE